MTIVGSAHVEIHAITSAVRDELREGLRRATRGVGRDAGREFGDEFGDEANGRIGDAARRSRRNISEEYGRTGDESGRSFFSRLSAIIRRPLNARVGVEMPGIRQAIVNIAALVNALQVVALPAAALGILPYLVSLAADATTAAGALWLLPAAMLGLSATIATLVIGFNGLGDALGPTGTPAQLEKVREAMAKLHPEARQVVRVLRGLGDEWSALRRNVQGKLFEDLAVPIRSLGQTYIPVLNTRLGETASAYNLMARNAIGALLLPQSIEDTNTGLGNMNAGLTSAAGATGPLVEAFRDIAVVGSEFFPRWGEGFAGMAERFRAFIAEARATGELRQWIQNALDVFSQLGRIAENVGSILGSSFDAIRRTGESTLDILERLTGSAAAFLKTPEGAESLRNFFQGIRDIVEAVAEKFVILWPAIVAAATAFRDIYMAAKPVLDVMLELAVDALVPVLDAISTLSPILGPLAAAMIAVSIAGKLFTAAIWLINAALYANPIVWIIALIVGLIAAIVWAWNEHEGFRKVVTDVWNKIQEVVGSVVEWFRGPFMDFWRGVGQFFSDLWADVSGFFVDAWDTISETVSDAFNDIVTFFEELPGEVGGFFTNLGTSILEGAQEAWSGLVTGLQNAWESVTSFLADLPSKVAYGLGYLVGSVARWAVDTWNSLYDALLDAWDNVTTFFSELPSNVATFFTNLMTTVGDWAVRTWNSVYDAAVDAWNGTLNWLQELPGRIGQWFVGLGVSIGLWAVNAWNSVTNAVTTAWNNTISFLGSIPGRIGTFFTDLWADITTWATDAWSSVTTSAVTAWNNTITFVQSIPGRIRDLFVNAGQWLYQAGADIINGIGTGIHDAWFAFWHWLNGLWQDFIQGFKDAFGISSPSTVFAEFGRWIIEGLLGGLEALVQNVRDFFTNLWTNIRETAVSVWSSIQEFFANAWTQFTEGWQTFWNNVRDFFSNLWNNIRQIAETVWTNISTFFVNAFDNFTGFFQDVWNNIRNFFATLWENIRLIAANVWTAISTFFTNAFNGFTGFFTNTWNNIKGIFEGAWGAIRDTGIRIWNSISGFFTDAFNTFTGVFTTVWNNIRDAFDRAFGGIKTIAERIWESVKSVFSTAINVVIRVPNWVIDKINGLFNTSIARIPDFRFAQGGTPADHPGRVSGIGGQTADRVHALLSPEEHVWSGREVRGAGGHEGVRRLREAARSGILKKETASYAASMRKAMQSSTMGMFARGGFVPALASGGELFSMVRSQFPRAKANSTYRPGDPGYHGRNMAVDLGEAGFAGGTGRPYLAAMKRWLVDNMGRAREIIYNGLGNDRTNVKNAAAYPYSAGIQAQHRNHVHLAHDGSIQSMKSSGLAGMLNAAAGGIGDAYRAISNFDLFDTVGGWVKGAAAGFMRGIIPDRPEWLEPFATGVLDKAWEGVRNWFGNGNADGGSQGGVGSGVERWRGTVQQALRTMGLPLTLADTTLRRMQKESGGNPRAINNWDVNARRGTPSKGLMQVIDPTFRSNAHPSYARDIWDPMSNILASMRYALRRYGSLPAAYDRSGGYDSGGWLLPGSTLAVNKTGKPEAVIPDPVTAFRGAMLDVFRRLAPELAFSLEAGASSQIEQFAKIVMNDNTRSPGLRDAISDAFKQHLPGIGTALRDQAETAGDIASKRIQGVLADILDEAPRTTQQASTNRIQLKWGDTLTALARRFGTSINELMRLNPQIKNANRIYAGHMLNVPGGTKTITEDVNYAMERRARELMGTLPPDLLNSFKNTFPDVINAVNDAAPNLSGILKARMTDIVNYFSTKAEGDVDALIDALSGGPGSTQELIKIGKEIVTPANTSTVKPTLTFQAGAFSVVIQGNADAVTVDELRTVLQGWGEQIVREYESQT